MAKRGLKPAQSLCMAAPANTSGQVRATSVGQGHYPSHRETAGCLNTRMTLGDWTFTAAACLSDLATPPAFSGTCVFRQDTVVVLQNQQCGWSSLWIWATPAGCPTRGQDCSQGRSLAELPRTHRPLLTPLPSRSVQPLSCNVSLAAFLASKLFPRVCLPQWHLLQ